MKKALIIAFVFYCHHVFPQTKNCFDVARRGSLLEIMMLFDSDKNVVNAIDANGSSMLILAAYYGNTEVAGFLADKVNNINYNSGMGTALMAAVVKGNLAIARKLLDRHCNINAVDSAHATALHFAVLFKNIDMVKLLLQFNPDLNMKDSNGVTPFELASISNNVELIALLKH